MIATHFAKFISQRHLPGHERFIPLVRELCEAVDNGSSCLDLRASADLAEEEWGSIFACGGEGSAVASPGASAPLILTPEGRLYLQRYYLHEQRIFEAVDARANAAADAVGEAVLESVRKLFGTVEGNDQAAAALSALQRRFTIISGGPGTGKTTTVLKILLLLKEQGHFDEATDCLLLAPTGKAADRLRQSILEGLVRLDIGETGFPTETSTIHRALGYRHDSIEFLHDAANPLNARVVVIDETSMVDLPLMSRLMGALRPDARAILLGDKNQLTSVQVGTVLADLMEVADSAAHPLKECAVTLRKSYRTQGPIHTACECIRAGDADKAWDEVTGSGPDVEGAIIHQLPPDNVRAAIGEFVARHWLPPLTGPNLTPREKLDAVDRFRILSPTHNGRFGVEAINRTVEQFLDAHGISVTGTWYPGRSVIVQMNDYGLGIYNGDTGLALDSGDGGIDVCFSSPKGYRSIKPVRLPEVKSAWALTIHRTQGSEYDHILLIIPPVGDSKILSRELLYTGLSRAKLSATIWCEEESFRATIATTVRRASGLPAMFSSLENDR